MSSDEALAWVAGVACVAICATVVAVAWLALKYGDRNK